MLHKPYSEKIHQIDLLYGRLIMLDSVQALEKAKKIKAFAKENGDESLALEMDLFWAYYLTENGENQKKSLRLLSHIATEAAEKKLYPLQIRAIRVRSTIYWVDLKQYDNAFEELITMAKVLEKTNATEYPDKVRDMNKVGYAYYYFQDYEKAIHYLKKSIAVEETGFNSLALAGAYNTLALCYQKIGDFEKSNYYLQKIASLQEEETKKIWMPIATGNVGYNYFLQKEYEKAVPLLQLDLKEAENDGDCGRAAGALIPLAEIAIHNKKLDLAWERIQKALAYISRSGQSDRLRLLYPVMSKWYTTKGRTEMGNRYLDSTMMANKRYDEKFSALKIMRAQQKINAQEQKLETARAVLEKKELTSERNRWILFMSILCFILTILYLFQKRKRELKALELRLAKNKLEKKAQELEMASVKLENFTKRIKEKNRLLKELQNHSDEKAAQLTEQLRESTILTPRDWDEFQNLFEQAYPGFIQRLTEKHPHLTTSEIRFFTLSKLGLSAQDMAAMIGVSQNTLQVTMHRARKKLNLPDNRSLKNMADSI
ncbi:MAG TPA: hypothetical protein VFM65_05885 [Flavobacteriaceae bacterium]|nr:hypothetical protein [Flavobacteriaceae bacterium]